MLIFHICDFFYFFLLIKKMSNLSQYLFDQEDENDESKIAINQQNNFLNRSGNPLDDREERNSVGSALESLEGDEWFVFLKKKLEILKDFFQDTDDVKDNFIQEYNLNDLVLQIIGAWQQNISFIPAHFEVMILRAFKLYISSFINYYQLKDKICKEKLNAGENSDACKNLFDLAKSLKSFKNNDKRKMYYENCGYDSNKTVSENTDSIKGCAQYLEDLSNYIFTILDDVESSLAIQKGSYYQPNMSMPDPDDMDLTIIYKLTKILEILANIYTNGGHSQIESRIESKISSLLDSITAIQDHEADSRYMTEDQADRRYMSVNQSNRFFNRLTEVIEEFSVMFENDRNNMLEQINITNQINNELKNEVYDLKNTVRVVLERLNSLEHQNMELKTQSEIQKFASEIHSSQIANNKNSLEHTADMIRGRIAMLENTSNHSSGKIRDLRDTLNDITQNIDRLENASHNEFTRVSRLTDHVFRLGDQVSVLGDRSHNESKRADELNYQVSGLRDRSHNESKRVDELNYQLSELRNEVKKQELQRFTNSIHNTVIKFQNITKLLKGEKPKELVQIFSTMVILFSLLFLLVSMSSGEQRIYFS
jgi:predicted  nucleic acid-binding Zn-ribbon protein